MGDKYVLKSQGKSYIVQKNGVVMFCPWLFHPSDNFGHCLALPTCLGVAHSPTNICCVIQEGVIIEEKCAHRGALARRERHTLSLGQNKHG